MGAHPRGEANALRFRDVGRTKNRDDNGVIMFEVEGVSAVWHGVEGLSMAGRGPPPLLTRRSHDKRAAWRRLRSLEAIPKGRVIG